MIFAAFTFLFAGSALMLYALMNAFFPGQTFPRPDGAGTPGVRRLRLAPLALGAFLVLAGVAVWLLSTPPAP